MTEPKKKTRTAYTKQQHLSSKNRTAVEKDILSVLLQDDQTYTNEQVQKIIQDFLKREVK